MKLKAIALPFAVPALLPFMKSMDDFGRLMVYVAALALVIAIVVCIACIARSKKKAKKAMAAAAKPKTPAPLTDAQKAAAAAAERRAAAAAEKAAAEEAPTEEAVAEETPVEEAVAEETPVEEAAAEETVAEEAPVEEAAAEEAAVEETVAEEAPVEETVAEEAPVEETVAEEAPVEEAVAEEAPVEEAVAEEAAVEEAPVEETVAEDEADEEDAKEYAPLEANVPVVSAEGKTVAYSTYRRSFLARIIGSPEDVQARYDELKNALLSYKKVNARISWSYESIKSGRTQLAKFAICGKTLCLFLAIDPNTLEDSKYNVSYVGDSKKYETVPCRLRLTSKRSVKWGLELIAMMAEKEGLEANPKYKAVSYVPANEPDEVLLEKGLIKKVQ